MERTKESWFTQQTNISAVRDTEAAADRFAREMHGYKQNLFRVAMSILKNYADAEDAVGECILQAYSHLDSLRSFERFKPWVMKILVRECYQIGKRRQRIEYHDDIQQYSGGVHDEHRELWDVVQKLPDQHRVVVTLYYYENLDTAEIARILKIPAGTVKSRLARARAKMKLELSKEGGK